MSLSRRSLARYAVDQLEAKRSPASLSRQLAAGLIAAKRPKDADLLLSDIAAELETRGLLTSATITSAHSLSAQLKTKLEADLKKLTKADSVALTEIIDPSVIGGLRVETANHNWDRTIARQLSDIRGGING